MRVLIVEDDEDQRRLLELVVRQRGHEVAACGTIADARAQLPCDLAIVDRNLPDGDGLELALELAREIERGVYLLTGDEGLRSTGGLTVLTKPVRPAQLAALLG